MGFEIKYRTLFELNVWNQFFLNKGAVHFYAKNPNTGDYILTPEEQARLLKRYDIRRFVDIQPTRSCKETIRNYQLILRPTDTGLLVAAKVGEESNNAVYPWLPFDERLQLTFLLRVVDPTFYNYSELPLSVSKNTVYYFNNLVNPADHQIDLTPREPDADALSYVHGVDPVIDADPVIVFQPLHPLEVGGKATVTAKVYSMTSGATPAVYEKTWTNTEDEPVQWQLDLRGLAAGWYRLEQTGAADTLFYLNQDGLRADTLAVVELFGRNADDDRALLNDGGGFKYPGEDPDSKFLPATFELRFKNRETIWRYLNANNEQQCEQGPYPLTFSGRIDVQCQGKAAPNPSARMIKQEGTDFISEIYL